MSTSDIRFRVRIIAAASIVSVVSLIVASGLLERV